MEGEAQAPVPVPLMYFAQLVVTGLGSAAASVMIALGFQLIFATTRIFHFVYAAIYSLAAYLIYASVKQLGLVLPVALVVAAVVVLALTAAIELLVYRPMRRRDARVLPILIASLGLLTALQSVMAIVWGNINVVASAPAVLGGAISVGGLAVRRIVAAEVVLVLVVFGLLLLMLRTTRFGKQVRAVADDAARARMLGLDVDRVFIGTFLVGTLILVPMAALQVMDAGVTPYGATDILLIASIIAFVGGIGSLTGALITGLGVGVLSGIALVVVPSAWIEALTYAALTLVILVRPVGLFGQARRQGRT